ncbi:hypothetical protein [Caulobacter sp. 1776]|uniref:hypothetical protein n=1 Tax=Caulobacter sp. 1776 TaxID=3156420 RepID=UPI0033947CE1
MSKPKRVTARTAMAPQEAVEQEDRVALQLRTSKIRDQKDKRIPRRTVVLASPALAEDLVEQRLAVRLPADADLSSARLLG